MPSTYSASARYTLQATGENNNTWGGVLNTGTLVLVDFNVNGWTTKALTGDYTLTTANGAADEARSAMLKFTGSGSYAVTIPSVSKRYDVWNALTGTLTITNGSMSVTVLTGEVVSIITDGTSVKRVVPTAFGGSTLTGIAQINGVTDPTTAQQVATKNYVDTTVTNAGFTMGTFGVPISPGDNGKYLTNNGSLPSWSYVTAAADYVTDRAALVAQSIAFAASL